MSANRSRRFSRTRSKTRPSYSRAAGSNPYGPPSRCACPWSALAMNATRRLLCAATEAIAAPAVTWSEAGRSRAGVTTTIGKAGSRLPPMNHSGISTPQSIGATAVAGSLEPKLTPAAVSPAPPIASSTRHASSMSEGTSSSIGGTTPFNRPFTRLATTTPKALAMCTLCGVATTVTSGAAAANRRPSSSMPARVTAATSRSSGAHASAMAMPNHHMDSPLRLTEYSHGAG